MFKNLLVNNRSVKQQQMKECHYIRKVSLKNLHKAIMTRSRLLSKYRKEKSETNCKAHKKQGNHCVKLL